MSGYGHLLFAGLLSHIILRLSDSPNMAIAFFTLYPIVLLIYREVKKEKVA